MIDVLIHSLPCAYRSTFSCSASTREFDVYSPTTTELVTSVCEVGVEDVDAVVDAAVQAFEVWSDLQAAERGQRLTRLADKMEQNIAELSRLEAITMLLKVPKRVPCRVSWWLGGWRGNQFPKRNAQHLE